jgi:hypothetical protein
MGDDFEEELTVAASIEKLVLGQAPERETAQDERAGVECEFLVAVRSLFSNHQDGVDLLCTPGSDLDSRRD